MKKSILAASLLFSSTMVFAEPEPTTGQKVYSSVVKMLDGSQISTRYLYTEAKGTETANKAQWRVKLNFTYVLSKDEKGDPQWVLRGIAAPGTSYDSGWDNLAGTDKRKKIQTPNDEYNLKHLWLEYNWKDGTAQVGSMETVAKGFSPGVASLNSHGWVKGGRYIGKNLEALGLKVDRVAITVGRIDDFNKLAFTDGWGGANYYDVTVEATPIKDLKVALSQSVFTDVPAGRLADYSPRIYAEYNTAKLFKDVIDSISVESRFHTNGNYPVQRFALALNKKIKEGYAKDWAAQIAYVYGSTDELQTYALMNDQYKTNGAGQNQGNMISFNLETPVLKKFGPFEVKGYSKVRVGVGDDVWSDNTRVDVGVTAQVAAPKDTKTALFSAIAADIEKRDADLQASTNERLIKSGGKVIEPAVESELEPLKATEDFGN